MSLLYVILSTLTKEVKMDPSSERMIKMYSRMLKIRRFEEKIEEMATAGKIKGFAHLYIGQEAVAVGVCAALKDSDYITSTHRGHGHLIAKGGDIKLMMAELFGKSTGYCKGKGGSMHIASLDLGILGANGIVGAGPPIAVGAGLAEQYKGSDNVSVTFFGDGASNQGTVHEAMNLSSIWGLPVVFVAEYNGYGEFMRQADHQCIESITERAQGYHIPGVSVDGNDVIAVYKAATNAIENARAGKGPTILECKTYRIKGHHILDPAVYRDPEEVDAWTTEDKDSILRFKKHLLEQKILIAAEIEDFEISIKNQIEEAVQFAEESPEPEIDDLLIDVYAE
jgi:pyruvate dehydrogenase E1 component alpha subunit